MKKEQKLQVLATRVPAALIQQLDKRAKQSRRTRSAEVLIRLEQSLRTLPTLTTANALPQSDAAPAAAPVNGAGVVAHA